MKILVCGGRFYKNISAVFHALDTLHAKRGITLIIQGGATGADSLAHQWANMRNVPCQEFAADWKKHGRAAGPMRNAQMLIEALPDGVVAFPGDSGTKDMISKAEKAGIKVWKTGGWQTN